MNNEFLSKVFKWFGLGLLVTFLVAYAVSINESLLQLVFSSGATIIIVILELVCAIWLSVRIHKMQTSTATMLYLGYTALTGLTFSSIFILYELESIMKQKILVGVQIFLATAILFGILSLIGAKTKINLSGLGVFLIIGLLAIIIISIINMFLLNNTIDLALCIISIVIFMGYVAYDVQKICRINTNNDNIAIIAAFDIYLDFINIFIRLLQLFGKNRD